MRICCICRRLLDVQADWYVSSKSRIQCLSDVMCSKVVEKDLGLAWRLQVHAESLYGQFIRSENLISFL